MVKFLQVGTATILQKTLLEMFKGSFQKGILPFSLKESSNTFLPKTGKPNNECEHLRLISLRNVGVKVLYFS